LKNSLRPMARDGKIGAQVWRESMKTMLLLMAPFTPHMTEELWSRLGFEYSIHLQKWPVYDAAKAEEVSTTLVVQAGNKVIDRIPVAVNITEDEAKQTALAGDGARKLLNGNTPKKVVFVAGRMVAGKMTEPKVNIVT